MIKASVARQVGAIIHKTRQTALQADGITPLIVVGEVHFNVNRDHVDLHLDALAVEELDVDILAGTPFMALNDISVRPSLQQISIQDSHISYYGAEGPDPPQNHVRRTQSHVLRASPSSTVIWPGEYIDIQLPPQTTLILSLHWNLAQIVPDRLVIGLIPTSLKPLLVTFVF